jgi:hypothetical protein
MERYIADKSNSRQAATEESEFWIRLYANDGISINKKQFAKRLDKNSSPAA